MLCVDSPGALRQRADAPTGGTQRVDEVGGTDDVGNRIPTAQFMEADVVRRRAMNLPFNFSQQREDADRVPPHRGRQGAAFESRADLAEARVMVAVVEQ